MELVVDLWRGVEETTAEAGAGLTLQRSKQQRKGGQKKKPAWLVQTRSAETEAAKLMVLLGIQGKPTSDDCYFQFWTSAATCPLQF